ncbi:MAG: enoyl-CoA hydratase-related protein [Acidimicrobiales bacterium]
MAGGQEQAPIDFSTDPGQYRHWQVDITPPLANVMMAVTPDAGLRDDYELKLNSYDLGVDIELYDITQRLRFEHPEVRVVVVSGASGSSGTVFCAGANIQMLTGSTHGHKVNFCKFTNETRLAIEDATENSQQVWIAAINGTAAGGGYELALACDEIVMIDDRSSTVSLPEVPLLGVLPGTGGLTRLVDKRHVRRDLADVFATRTEGVKAQAALRWGLVDAITPASGFAEVLRARVAARAGQSDRPSGQRGITLTPLRRRERSLGPAYEHVLVELDRQDATATITVHGPRTAQPTTPEGLLDAGADAWLVAVARELEDAVLRLRFNETGIGIWLLRTVGSPQAVTAAEALLADHPDHWLVREVRLFWARTLRRLDLSARTVVAIIEPGSCFAGPLAELALAADQSFMLEGMFDEEELERRMLLEGSPEEPGHAVGHDAVGHHLSPASLRLSPANLGWFPMSNGESRLRTRFWGREDVFDAAAALVGTDLLAAEALQAELITFAPDELDWEDELRVMVEERASFSPDALTGMEANFRFVGPETMETKIFARLSAWQNWIFQRPNATGPDGALHRFGSGSRPTFDMNRV